MTAPLLRAPVSTGWLTGLLLASLGWLAPVPGLVGPPQAHATHAEAGDCPHVHDFIDDSFSVCTQKSTGKKCEKGGAKGTCQHKYVNVGPSVPPLQSEGSKCVCITDKDRAQATQIERMADATRTALSFSSVSSALASVNPTAACDQLGTSINEILRAKSSVLGHGAVQFYDTESMKHVDYVIANYATLDSFAASCSITGLPSIADVLSGLAIIKLQINSSFGRLLPS